MFFTIIVLLVAGLAGQASASDSLDSYLLKKQFRAAQTKSSSEALVQRLRNLPADQAYLVDTTATVKSGETAMKPPSAGDLNDIATASGSNKVAVQKSE